MRKLAVTFGCLVALLGLGLSAASAANAGGVDWRSHAKINTGYIGGGSPVR